MKIFFTKIENIFEENIYKIVCFLGKITVHLRVNYMYAILKLFVLVRTT